MKIFDLCIKIRLDCVNLPKKLTVDARVLETTNIIPKSTVVLILSFRLKEFRRNQEFIFRF